MTKEGFFKTFDISLSDAEVDFSEKKEVSIVQVVRTENVKIIFWVFLELVEKVQYLQKPSKITVKSFDTKELE